MLVVKPIVVTPFQQNARILLDESSKEAVIVDPGGDIPLILDQLPDDYTLSQVWITHSHIDHVSGVAALLNQSSDKPNVYAHPEDSINRDHLPMQSQMMGFPYSGDFNVDYLINHGDLITIGTYEFKVLHTPGHAIGHVSFYHSLSENSFDRPFVIAGDALFNGSIGRTDLPGGDHQQLLSSIREHLFSLPDQTIVCSGHGPNTTIETEKATNPFLNS